MKAANWAGLSSRDEKAHALVTRGDAEGHRLRNFVPKLGSIGYYHATCNCLWNGIIVRQGTARLVHHDLRSDSVCG